MSLILQQVSLANVGRGFLGLRGKPLNSGQFESNNSSRQGLFERNELTPSESNFPQYEKSKRVRKRSKGATGVLACRSCWAFLDISFAIGVDRAKQPARLNEVNLVPKATIWLISFCLIRLAQG